MLQQHTIIELLANGVPAREVDLAFLFKWCGSLGIHSLEPAFKRQMTEILEGDFDKQGACVTQADRMLLAIVQQRINQLCDFMFDTLNALPSLKNEQSDGFVLDYETILAVNLRRAFVLITSLTLNDPKQGTESLLEFLATVNLERFDHRIFRPVVVLSAVMIPGMSLVETLYGESCRLKNKKAALTGLENLGKLGDISEFNDLINRFVARRAVMLENKEKTAEKARSDALRILRFTMNHITEATFRNREHRRQGSLALWLGYFGCYDISGKPKRLFCC